MLCVGDEFPPFTAQACVGNTPDDLREIKGEDFAGKWRVFFFYPKDFTFVCPTELAEFGKQHGEFAERGALVFGGSTDNEYSHLAWRTSHEDLKDLPYPLLAANKLARDLGILDPKEDVCYRATFIVDPDGIIQWVSVNNLSCGRSVPEILRAIDSLQSGGLCPCNWKKGEATLSV